MKFTPGFTDFFMSPVTGILTSSHQLPSLYLPQGQVYVGDDTNTAVPSQTISLENLPNLTGEYSVTIPNPIDPSNPITVTGGKIWEGGTDNRPEESISLLTAEADILLINFRFIAAHFVLNSPGTLDSLRILMPASQFLVDVGIGITKLIPGGYFALAIPDTDYVLPATFQEAIQVLQDEIDVLTDDIAAINTTLSIIQDDIAALDAQIIVINSEIVALQNQVAVIEAEIIVINDGIAALNAEIVVINNEITALQAEVTVLTEQVNALGAEIVIINEEIDAIQAELVVINGEIVTIQGQIATLFADIVVINTEITTLFAAIATLQAEIATIGINIDIIFGELDNLRLNTIQADGNVSIYGYRLINVADPIDLQDAVTLNYFLDTLIGYVSIKLTGAVSGYGNWDTQYYVDTTFNLGLNEIIATGDVSVYGYKIIDLADPVISSDAATKHYVDEVFSGVPGDVDITLTGAVSGSGPSDSPINTTFNLTLNQIPNAGDVDIGGYKIREVSTPEADNDATNKLYVDNQIKNLPVTLEGFIIGGPAVDFVIETERGPDCLLTNIPAGGDVDMGGYRVKNLSDPVEDYDATSFSFLWQLLNNEVDILWS